MVPHSKELRAAVTALALLALLGVALIFVFPGCPEQDTEYHFLEARTAWSNPRLLVDVWGRPLYVAFYALPALLGFTAARFCAVAIGVVTACKLGAWHAIWAYNELGWSFLCYWLSQCFLNFFQTC